MKPSIYGLSGLLIGSWLLIAQGCMRFRTSDRKAVEDFARLGLALTPHQLAVGDRTMHYVSIGSPGKPTLVFIHGSPGSWDGFSTYLKDSLLLDRYRMVSVDRPGFGYSDFGRATGIQQQADLIRPLLHRLTNGKPMYLIGHSLGGPLVIKLAADNPDLPVSGLVILAGSVSPADEPRESWRYILDAPVIHWLLPGALRPSNHELKLFKQDVTMLQPSFARITCPVFIMHGDKDPLVPPPNAIYAQKMLVNSRHVELIWLKGANHFIPWTRYNYIRALLLRLDG